jgi:hypothetical protein
MEGKFPELYNRDILVASFFAALDECGRYLAGRSRLAPPAFFLLD